MRPSDTARDGCPFFGFGLITLGLVLTVISGVLGMHILNSAATPMRHGMMAAAPQLAMHDTHDVTASVTTAGVFEASLSATTKTSPGADTAGSSMYELRSAAPFGDGSGMAGCVLALLAASLAVLCPFVLRGLWPMPLLRSRVLPVLGSVLARPRPPSLAVLSISRT